MFEEANSRDMAIGKDGRGEPAQVAGVMMTKSGHVSIHSLARYARPSVDAVARWHDDRDPGRPPARPAISSPDYPVVHQRLGLLLNAHLTPVPADRDAAAALRHHAARLLAATWVGGQLTANLPPRPGPRSSPSCA